MSLIDDYPKTYLTFTGKQSNRQYWIQDLTENYFDRIMTYYLVDFINEEPTCKFAGVPNDPISMDELAAIWRERLTRKMSVICLFLDENGEEHIAGYNTLYITQKCDESVKVTGTASKKVMYLLNKLEEIRNVFEEYEVDHYLAGLGLFVYKEFRGDSIATHLLKARDFVGKKFGCQLSGTAFSSYMSQGSAKNAGFSDFTEIFYDDLETENPEMSFKGAEQFAPSCKFMVKVFK